MGKGSAPKPPAAPDYTQLATQQGQMNQQNAMQQWLLQNTSQYTPFGSTGLVADPNDPLGIAKVTTLNPADQARLDQQRALQSQIMGGLPGLAQQVMGGNNNSQYLNANGQFGGNGTPSGLPAGLAMSTANNPQGNLNAVMAEGGYVQDPSSRAGMLAHGTANLGQMANIAGTYNDIGSTAGTLGDDTGQGQVAQQVNPWVQKGMQTVDFSNLGKPVQNVNAGDMQMNLQDPNAVRQNAIDAAYNNWANINEPQYARQQESERARIANMGGVTTSAGARNAMGDLNQQQNLARNEAMNQAVLTGGNQAAQNMGMLNTAGQFTNAAQAQQFGQGMQNAGLYNQGITQLMGMLTGQAGFNNPLVQQSMANELQKQQIKAGAAGAMAGAQASTHATDVNAQTQANQLSLTKLMDLYGMSGVSNPTFAGTGGAPNIQAPNLYGAGQDQYNAGMGQYNSELANYNNQQQGVGNMIGTAAMVAATIF